MFVVHAASTDIGLYSCSACLTMSPSFQIAVEQGAALGCAGNMEAQQNTAASRPCTGGTPRYSIRVI